MNFYGGLWGYTPANTNWIAGTNILIGGTRITTYVAYVTYYTNTPGTRLTTHCNYHRRFRPTPQSVSSTNPSVTPIQANTALPPASIAPGQPRIVSPGTFRAPPRPQVRVVVTPRKPVRRFTR